MSFKVSNTEDDELMMIDTSADDDDKNLYSSF